MEHRHGVYYPRMRYPHMMMPHGMEHDLHKAYYHSKKAYKHLKRIMERHCHMPCRESSSSSCYHSYDVASDAIE